MPKGWKLSSSPGWSICKTFMFQFYFQTAVKSPSTSKKTYRNPICLAKEYKRMIETGKVKNQAELARIKGISRARVTQILNLLKLDDKVIDRFEQFGDSMVEK